MNTFLVKSYLHIYLNYKHNYLHSLRKHSFTSLIYGEALQKYLNPFSLLRILVAHVCPHFNGARLVIIGYWLDMEIYVRVLVRNNIARRQERNINYTPERVKQKLKFKMKVKQLLPLPFLMKVVLFCLHTRYHFT